MHVPSIGQWPEKPAIMRSAGSYRHGKTPALNAAERSPTPSRSITSPQLRIRAPRCPYAHVVSMRQRGVVVIRAPASQQPQTRSQATLPRPCRLAYSTVGSWIPRQQSGRRSSGTQPLSALAGAQSRYAIQPTLNPLLGPPMPGHPPSPPLAPPHSLRTRLVRQGAKNFCCA